MLSSISETVLCLVVTWQLSSEEAGRAKGEKKKRELWCVYATGRTVVFWTVLGRGKTYILPPSLWRVGVTKRMVGSGGFCQSSEVGAWNSSFQFYLCVLIQHQQAAGSDFGDVYLLWLSECFGNTTSSLSFHVVYRTVLFCLKKNRSQQMSQNHPASVCSFSSCWTTILPRCICTSGRASVCSVRQVGKTYSSGVC